jgi:hypothetical protein
MPAVVAHEFRPNGRNCWSAPRPTLGPRYTLRASVGHGAADLTRHADVLQRVDDPARATSGQLRTSPMSFGARDRLTG